MIEISERIKRPEPKKDRSADGPISRKQGSNSKTIDDLLGRLSWMYSVLGVTRRNTMLSVPMQRQRKGRGTSRSGSSKSCQQPASNKKDDKSIRHFRESGSGDHDPFLQYWTKIYDLSGSIRCDLTHPRCLVFR